MRWFLSAARPSPFMLHGWVAAWWSVYRPDLPTRCITVRQDGRLVGALAISIERRSAVRVGRLTGALALGDALVADVDAHAICAELAAAFRRQPLDVVDFDGIARESVLATCLPAPFRLVEAIPAPTLAMPDGWEAAYERQVGAATRRTNRRALRRLSEDGEYVFVCHQTEPDISRALDDAFRLHAIRWAGRRDTSSFGTPEGRAFHRAALGALSRAGYVRLIELRLDDVAIAFQLSMLVGDATFGYRSAFDPETAAIRPASWSSWRTSARHPPRARRGSSSSAATIRTSSRSQTGRIASCGSSAYRARSGGRAYMEITAGTEALRTRLRRNERLRHAVRRTPPAWHRRPGGAGGT